MTKLVAYFVFFAFASLIQSSPVVKRDVSEILRHHVPGHVVYGNGIPGDQAEIVNEHFRVDGIGNYDFG